MNKAKKNDIKKRVPKKALQKGVSARPGINSDKRRFHLMWFVTTICFLALFSRALWLQVIKQPFYAEKAESAIERTRTIEPSRGVVYDRNNIPLALSVPMKTLSFNAREYAEAKYLWEKEKQKIIKTINFLTDEEQQEIRQKIDKKDARFNVLNIAETVDYDADVIKKLLADTRVNPKKPKAPPLPFSQYLMLKRRIPTEVSDIIMKKRFAGVHSVTEYKRYYPQPQPNVHVLGFMGRNVTKARAFYEGKSGIEKLYEKSLAGTPGKIKVVKGAKGFGVVDDTLLQAEVAGAHLVTSIDSRLQYILYRELEKVGRLHSARSASGVVLDAQTGEVLAMSNWPSFNSNSMKERNNHNERNRALVDVFEPGSVVKPLTVIAGLESGKFHKNSVINTGGRIVVGNKVFLDHGAPLNVSMQNLIKYSSNLASIKIGQALPRAGVANMFQKLGLGKKTALNFPSEPAGNVTPPSKRQKQRRANMTFGYSIEVSLAQLAQAYSIIASNGVLRPLTLEKQEKTRQGEQIISANNANSVLNMMKSVVYGNGGTGKRAKIKGYTVAGKTGTAKKLQPDNKAYYADKYRSLFIGIAPVSKPKFVTAILVEDPLGDYAGGKVAAPVFSQVTGEALRLYNIPMDRPLK